MLDFQKITKEAAISSTCRGILSSDVLAAVTLEMPDNSKNTPQKPSVAAPSKRLKYAQEFRRIPGCPFDANAPFGDACYRIVHAEIDRKGNFSPVAVLAPERLVGKDDQCQCDSWSLSMFETRDQLKKHLKKMEQTNRNWRKLVGDHGVKLKVTADHGKRTAATRSGHFSFFEYVDFDAKSVVADHFSLVS